MMSTDAVIAQPFLCPGMLCTGRTMARDELCESCWSYRPTLHSLICMSWHNAHNFLPPAVRHGEPISGGAGPGSRAPLNHAVLEAIETALAVVVGWASVVRERASMAAMPGLGTARPAWLFDQAMPTLAKHDHLLEARSAVDYYADLYRTNRTLSRITHEEMQETEHLPVACPSCNRLSIVSREYGDRVVCLTCGSEWGQSAWHAQLHSSALR